MRITLEQPRLLKILQTIERAVNERSTLPILANILFETTEHHLTLRATDLDIAIQYQVPLIEHTESGAVTIPARRFSAIVRELPEDPVTIEAKKNHSATITCGPSQFRIQGLPAEDFPPFPPLEHSESVTIPQATLKHLLSLTAFAMSIEETRFVLNGALLKLTHQELTMVTADGRRLAAASASTPKPVPKEIAVVIPSKTVHELGRLLEEDEEESIAIALLKDNQLLFQFGPVSLITRLIEGQFPQYESVIPVPSKTTVTCNRQLLLGAIRRASLMTTATSQAVTLDFAKEQLVVSKESPELGSASEELEARYTGGPIRMACNPGFWIDVLKVLDSDDVAIELATATQGVAAEAPLPDRAVIRLPHFLYLVMAMKLS